MKSINKILDKKNDRRTKMQNCKRKKRYKKPSIVTQEIKFMAPACAKTVGICLPGPFAS